MRCAQADNPTEVVLVGRPVHSRAAEYASGHETGAPDQFESRGRGKFPATAK